MARTVLSFACAGLFGGIFGGLASWLFMRSLSPDERNDRRLRVWTVTVLRRWYIFALVAGPGGALGGYVASLIMSHRL